MADDNDDLDKQRDDMDQAVQEAMETIFDRPITPQEFYFLLSRYPYLQICNADDPFIPEGKEPEVKEMRNGWMIHNYGSVIRGGAYELLALMRQQEIKGKIKQANAKALAEGREKAFGEDEEEGGHGTIVQQYTDAAFAMIQLAIQNGWKLADILSGFYPMQRMAWIAGLELGLPVKGFVVTDEDRVIQNWVAKIRSGKLYPPKRPILR